MKINKTVIGSFPTRKGLTIEQAIREIVDLQLKYGINIISDGEQRADMVEYFYQLKGLIRKPHGLGIESKVESLENVREFVKLKDYYFVKDYLKKISREDVKVKVTITGPITLGFSLALNGLGNYSSIRDLRIYEDTARALNPIIEYISKLDCYIQIDEPSLSTRVMEANQAIKFVNEALGKAKGNLIAHVCGALTKDVFDSLFNLNVNTLSLAFSGPEERRNINLLSKELFEFKQLGFGCISVLAMREEEVEEVSRIEERIDKMVEKLGIDKIGFYHPDCGLRSNTEKVAEKILENMSKAVSNYFFKKRI
ncbi:MAG: hypothetical protein QXX95_06535 [Nitrososphaerales archaeon]